MFLFFRHIEMEAQEKREKFLRKMKENMKMLMIALMVLAIEKLSEFFTSLFNGSDTMSTVKDFDLRMINNLTSILEICQYMSKDKM